MENDIIRIKRKLRNKKIGVLMGGWSAEREVSLLSGTQVLKALKTEGLKAIGIDVDRNIVSKLKRNKIQLAFIALHGPFGEDGTVQGMLEILGIPYTGSGVLASALGINKIYTKKIFEASGLPVPKWSLISLNNPKFKERNFSNTIDGLKFPLVVKPATQGSALGISIVKKKKELPQALKLANRYSQEIIIEEYIKGKEITVSILGKQVLPVIEIVPVHKFYDFYSKYETGKSQHIIPARLPKKCYQQAQNYALLAYESLDCKVFSRVDMMVDRKEKIYLLEINTIPGMTKTSLVPDAARYAGISFNHLVLKILDYSLEI